ncbi:MAG: hypothetical protein R6X20_08505 [Phycisphaerae bacterium]
MGRTKTVAMLLAVLAVSFGAGGCEEPAQREDETSPLQERQGTPEGQSEPHPSENPLAWADPITGAEVDESAVGYDGAGGNPLADS